jgi:tripartite-type tricarboxylate transporter receptor subunit TctC
MELFKHMARIDIVHVAYKGGPPAAVDLVAGQIGMMFFNTPAALPFVKAGKLRALGVSSARRSPLLPEVPTIAEAGVPGFEIEVWNGLVVRTGTAPAIIRKTSRDVLKVLAMPDVRRQLLDIGAEPVGNAPEEFARRMEVETEKWANVVRAANIRFE